MNNNQEKHPELDYFELRRRHEEYKSRQRMTEEAAPQTEEKAAPVRPAAPVRSRNAAPVENIPEDIDPDQAPTAADFDGDGYAEDYDDEAYDDAYADEPEPDINPFKTLFRFAKGATSKITGRGKKVEEEYPEEYPEEYADGEYPEEYADGEYPEDYPEAEETQPRKRGLFARKQKQSDFDEAQYDDLEEGGPIEDIAEDLPGDQLPASDEYADEYYEDYDPDLDDEAYDPAPQSSGFKRFLNLFVVRVDDLPPADDQDEYYDDEYEDDYVDEAYEGEPYEAFPEEEARRPLPESALLEGSETEGGLEMDEMNRALPESNKFMAEALETSGMSRRERRELAMRLAAEEAARAEEQRLAEETAQAEAQTVEIEEAPAAEPVVEAPVEEAPAAESSIEDMIVEEPTREFKPINLRAVQEAQEEEIALFDVEDDDEDEEEEEEIKKPRRGLFGRKRAKQEEIEEDEDDEDLDDEDDFDDEDDDEDEEDERPARRGLFGRRKKVVEEDEDDDYDDDDDFDDEDDDEDDEYEDEDDSYDEYEDDEDEYDDEDAYDDDEDDDEDEDFDDEDEGQRSFGHHLLGAFKIILGVFLALLIAILALNVVYVTGGANIVDKLHDRFGESSAFKFLFFGHGMRREVSTENNAPAIIGALEEVDEIEAPVKEPVIPEETAPVVSIPDLDTNTEEEAEINFGTETEPVIEAADEAAEENVG